MSDIELDREDDGPAFEEDHSHQACYVFRPFAADDLEDQKPTKKRRKTKHSPEEQLSAFPLLNHGDEPLEFARIRYHTFKAVWERQKGRIDALVQQVDETTLTKIVDFVQQPPRNDAHKLQTGLVVSGPDGGAQVRFLEKWQQNHAKDSKNIIIQLRASQCVNLQNTLKNIIKGTICQQVGQEGYQVFFNKHKRLIPMNFDLELLQIFVKQHDIQKVVLSILDVETFDIGIIAELFSTLCSWTDAIPFTILLGIATTVDLFDSRLPRSTIELLDATTFTLQSSDTILQQILDDLQNDPEPHIKFGPLTISALEELTQSQGVTIDTFTNVIKYLIMSHFFANSLSVLLTSNPKLLLPDPSLCKAIRNTPSFQEYCEDILQSNKTEATKQVTRLLTDDKSLLEAALYAAKQKLSDAPFVLTPSASYKGPARPPFSALPLPECHTINTRTLLNPFIPRGRHALERALAKPSDYLGCECCQTSSSTTSRFSTNTSPPPTSTLYTLLQEAGTIINVRDLYDAFCARQFPLSSATNEDDNEADTKADRADRSQMSVFYTALAELKMLGLVKGSSSAGVKKKALGGPGGGGGVQDAGVFGIGIGRGKDRYGDVDFVAKTGWAGL